MEGAFKAVKITDRVYWVGAIDWAIRDFHGYATSRGTTYNAYLVLADKVALFDTVKAPFMGEMMARIASVVDPAKIDYIISNHSEMDHSGALPATLVAVKPDRVLASKRGVKALAAHFHRSVPVEAVGDGDTLDLGGVTATFVETPMLHWPDSMMTYLAEEKMLISQDGFGQHLASTERYADEVPAETLRYEAAKYFANILLRYAPLVTKAVARLRGMDLALEFITPDHGPIYRKDVTWIIDLWDRWAAQKPTRKAVVVFDTMWQSTALMARVIADGLREGGAADVQVIPMRSSHRSDVATELLEAGALVVGSPTINNMIFPTLGDVLVYLEGLRRQGLIGAAFGSYGWGGEAVGRLEEWLKAMKVDLVVPGLKVQYVPDAAALTQCRAFGRAIGEGLVRHVAKAG